MYLLLKKVTIAIDSYKKAIEFNPNYPQIYYNLANIYNETSQCDLAIENYKKAIALDPTFFIAYNNLGIAYAKEGQYDLAVENHEKAIELKPDFVNAYNSLGVTYYKLRQYNLSINNLNKALELNSNDAEIYKNLGVSYIQTDLSQAKEALKKSIELNPNNKETYNSLAIAYYLSREVKPAIENYNKAIKIDPGFYDAYANLSAVKLLSGDFEEGWKLYEYRFLKESTFKIRLPKLNKPRWNGEDLKDKTIYVYKEQGFGDTIMFSRYVPLLKSMAKKVIFRPQPQLISLFKSSNFDVEMIDDSISDEQIEFDNHIPLLSLPLMFKTTLNNIPYTEQYIKADPEKVNSYKEKYFNNDNFKVGIFWLGDHRYVPQKSTKLSYFYKFAELPNVKLYSLQKGYGSEQLKEKPENVEITDLGQTFDTYSDTAAAIANLDLVITIDTSVAHLAGAMSIPTWVLLHTENEWRWMMQRDDSPWYKSLKLFRQRRKDNWEELFQRVLESLKEKLANQI